MTPLVAASAAVFGALFAGCGVVIARHGAPRVVAGLFLAVGVALLGGSGLHALTPSVGDRLVVLAALVLWPVLVLVLPDGRAAPGVGRAAVVLAVVTGLAGVVVPSGTVVSVCSVVLFCLLASCVWWRYEHAPDGERRSLLWLVLTVGTCGLLAGHITFLSTTSIGAVGTAVVLAVVPVGAAVGVVSPHVLDVRAVATRVVVEAFALIATVAFFVGALTVLGAVPGAPAGMGSAAVVAAVCAMGYHPLRTVLLGSVDRLLFGEREDPVRAASHVGRTLADPVLALRSLREALVLPHAALFSGEEVVAVSGVAGAHRTSVPLVLGERVVGRLEVGLRPGELRVSRRDREVLDVLAPALAQMLHALALTDQLHASRAGVIVAVEEERRRLRHDLHDTVGPTLTGIAYTADAARNTLDDDPARALALLAALREDTSAAIDDVRRVVQGLRPPAVDELGLVAALRQQVVSLYAADGRPVAVTLQAQDPLAPLTAAVEVAAFRIVTEALTNVVRHAGCHEAEVRLWCEGGRLAVEVSDGGTERQPWVPGIGLTSMRERAEQLGGSFTTAAGAHGGLVRAELPLG